MSGGVAAARKANGRRHQHLGYNMAFDELSLAADGELNALDVGGANCFKKLGYLGTTRAGDNNPDKVRLFAASNTDGGDSSNQ